MRLTLDALAVLEAIDRQGSFAAAAEELHRVPSAITYAVQKLEQDLDVLIFDRRGHRALLTDTGRELLREGRHLLQAAAELESRVMQKQSMMPDGLVNNLTAEELSSLIAYLQSLTSGVEQPR